MVLVSCVSSPTQLPCCPTWDYCSCLLFLMLRLDFYDSWHEATEARLQGLVSGVHGWRRHIADSLVSVRKDRGIGFPGGIERRELAEGQRDE